jgi:acetyltransferase-like isoleucine patch superfamily enzyme
VGDIFLRARRAWLFRFGIIPSLRRESSRVLRLKKLKKQGLVSIGSYSYGFHDAYFWNDETKIAIGKYCSIAEGVIFILGGEHRADWVTTYPFSAFPNEWESAANIPGHPASKGDIVIGNDVWIGNGALILSGVTVGHGAIIGARSVITKDIEPYAIYAGNPAKFIRYRFEQPTREELLRLAWWDWPHEKVVANMPQLLKPPQIKNLREDFL